MMREKYFIEGGVPLRGAVEISGSKNAALPILAASILITGVSQLRNVPEIEDVETMMDILESIGVEMEMLESGIQLSSDNVKIESGELSHPKIKSMRASILLLAPLLARFGEVKMPFPGGCVLGKRPIGSHLAAFTAFGAEILDSHDMISISAPKGLRPATFVLPEISVTATENAVMLASSIEGESIIRMAASEPHVQNLCEFLVSAGAQIDGIGTHTLRIRGTKNLSGGSVEITPDYLEAGTFILAAAVTNGELIIRNVEEHHLDSFFQKLKEVGVNFVSVPEDRTVIVKPPLGDYQPVKLQTGVFPAFPTDLHPQFAVLLTQCAGTSQIFETLFERKFAYLLELEKMGANVQLLNPHQFLVHGKSRLRGSSVASQDIRAGAAMLLAAFAAEGETEISNIHYIHRGYEKIEEKLKSVGARISRSIEE